MKAGLKYGVTFLGVILLLIVILGAVFLPAIVVPFANVASAVDYDTDYNYNLLLNGQFKQDTQGLSNYVGNATSSILTFDNWYLFGFSVLLSQPFGASLQLTSSSSSTAYFFQKLPRLSVDSSYTFSVVPYISSTLDVPYYFTIGTLNNTTNEYVSYSNVLLGSSSSVSSDSPALSYVIRPNSFIMEQVIQKIYLSRDYINGVVDLCVGLYADRDVNMRCPFEGIKFEVGEVFTGFGDEKYDSLLRDYNKLLSNFNSLNDRYDSLLEEYENLKSYYENMLDVYYNQGYNVGYNKGVESGSNYTFLSLIGAVVDAPLGAFRSMFNFEILGMNMSSFLLSLFSISIIIVVIKLLIGR